MIPLYNGTNETVSQVGNSTLQAVPLAIKNSTTQSANSD